MMSRGLLKILTTSIVWLAAAHSGWAQPIIAPGKTARHNLQVDARGNHLSGMMIARQTANGPRVLATSYFGPTIFDFSLTPDSLKVNSCVEPMRHPKALQLLERDLRVLLVDRNRAKRILREGFRSIAAELPADADWVFVGRSALRDKRTGDVVEELRRLVNRCAAF